MPKAPDGTIMDESSSDEEMLVLQLAVLKKKLKDAETQTQTQPVVRVPVHARNAIPVPQVP